MVAKKGFLDTPKYWRKDRTKNKKYHSGEKEKKKKERAALLLSSARVLSVLFIMNERRVEGGGSKLVPSYILQLPFIVYNYSV